MSLLRRVNLNVSSFAQGRKTFSVGNPNYTLKGFVEVSLGCVLLIEQESWLMLMVPANFDFRVSHGFEEIAFVEPESQIC